MVAMVDALHSGYMKLLKGLLPSGTKVVDTWDKKWGGIEKNSQSDKALFHVNIVQITITALLTF